MGQVALGFRSLLIKLAIFFVMAALLAWALGGTLWPRAEIVDLGAVSYGGDRWFWRLEVGGREQGSVRYRFMRSGDAGEPHPLDAEVWRDVAGPVVGADGVYAGMQGGGEAWLLRRWTENDAFDHTYPDRLAIERQLARVVAGLPPEDPATIATQRAAVLNPGVNGN